MMAAKSSRAAGLAAALIAAGALAGCHAGSSGHAAGSGTGQAAHGSPLAQVPGADAAAMQEVARLCSPAAAGGSAQLRWATALMNDTMVHPNGARNRLLDCAGIPAAKRAGATGALLAEVRRARWDKRAGRAAFFGTALPAWVAKWRSG